MLGCIQPMSSPMMNRMLGFFSWATAGAADPSAATVRTATVAIVVACPNLVRKEVGMIRMTASSNRWDVCKSQKKPQRNTYRGFFHHEYEAWASRDPSHRNTT